MANLLTPGLLLEGRIWCNKDTQDSVTTLHWLVSTVAGGAPTDVDFLSATEAIYGPLFKGMIWNGAKYLGMTMQVLTPPIGILRANSTSQGVGTGGTQSLPSQSSGLISWLTNLGGRAYRGRIYMPFPTAVEDNNDGFPDAGYIIGLDAIGTEYVSHTSWTLGGATCVINPCLRHRKNKAGITPAPTIISSHQSSNLWATQRKRGAFGRPNTSPFG